MSRFSPRAPQDPPLADAFTPPLNAKSFTFVSRPTSRSVWRSRAENRPGTYFGT
jgi:hypothetical protein